MSEGGQDDPTLGEKSFLLASKQDKEKNYSGGTSKENSLTTGRPRPKLETKVDDKDEAEDERDEVGHSEAEGEMEQDSEAAGEMEQDSTREIDEANARALLLPIQHAALGEFAFLVLEIEQTLHG